MIGHYSQLAHQGISDPSRSMANGGGSGGGSSPAANPDTRYGNLDALYGTQNQASQFMLNNALPYVPQLTQNSINMTSDAMDGTLSNQMREQAGNESQATFGAALGANDRNMQRYGMGMNSNRIMSENNRNAILGAASKTGAMNRAAASAEDMKWNRNAGAFGQVMGMNNGAMQGMSSAASGMANTANQLNANDQRNAAGYGQAGAAFGAALTKADGGYIEGEKPVRLADGGDAWQAYKAANPVKPMSTSSGSSTGKRTNPYMAMLGGAAPSLLGAGLKDVFQGDKSKIVDGVKKAYNGAKSAVDSYQATQNAKAIADAGDAAQASALQAQAAELEQTQALFSDTASYAGQGYDGASAGYDAASNSVDPMNMASATSDAAAAASATQTASELSTAADVTSAGLGGFATGGYIKKRGLKLALGGMASSSVANSNKIDNTSGLAQMDASGSMSVANMGTTKTNNSAGKPETHAKPVYNIDTQYSGKTDGMGESSDGDPDGFGVHSGDNRHIAGKTTMQAVGSWLLPKGGSAIGGALAEVLHPVGEAVSRNVIRAGDKLGGASGALILDPIGTTVSGKYSNEELAKGHLGVAAGAATGMPWLGKFLADGGRVDHTDGGEVDGPGTETSDDIPAWLSDGEYVLNAEAVKLVGKQKLDKINKAGLKRRGGTGPGLEMANGTVSAAGGGFMGGNLGIAMGAGVEQWNKQQLLDQRDQEIAMHKEQAARQNEQFNWQRQQHDAAVKKQAGLDSISAEYAPKVMALAKGDMSGFVKPDGTQMTPEEAQSHLMGSYHAANASMGGSGLSDFVKYTADQRKQTRDDGYRSAQERRLDAQSALSQKQLDQKIANDKIDAELRRQQIAQSGAGIGLRRTEYQDEKAQKAQINGLRSSYLVAQRTDPEAAKALADNLWFMHGVDIDGRSVKGKVTTHIDTQNGNAVITDGGNVVSVPLPTHGSAGQTQLYGNRKPEAAPKATVTKAEVDAEWDARGKSKFRTRAEFDASLAAKGYAIK